MQDTPRYNIKRIVIAGILVLILAGIIAFFVIRSKNNGAAAQLTNKNIFPFNGSTVVVPPSPNVPGGTDGTTTEGQSPLSLTDSDRLRQITNYPVTGFFSTIVNRVISEPQTDPKTHQDVLVSSIVPTNLLRWNVELNGLIMEADINRNLIVTRQRSSTRIPSARELWGGNAGNTFVFRSWNSENKTIDSYIGSFPPPIVVDYCAAPLTKNIKKGAKDTEISQFQNYLNQKLKLGISIDGRLAGKTYASLKSLQNVLNITQTGAYDQATRDAVNLDCAKIQSDAAGKNNAPVSLSGSFLPPGILRGTVSPDGTKIFFLTPSDGGVTGTIANINGTGQRKIFESPLTEWSPQWASPTTIAMTTLASHEAVGYLYFLNVANGDFKKVFGPIQGLTTLTSPDAKEVLFSQSTAKGIVTALYSTTTGAVQKIDLSTLPAKCTWETASVAICAVPQNIPSAQYPDDWYQGNLTLNDEFWTIDTAKSTTNLLFTPSQKFDVRTLGTSPDNAYLYFINKIDDTLWSYRLSD